MDLIRSHVMVCGGTGCSSSNSAEIIKEFEKQLVYAPNGNKYIYYSRTIFVTAREQD